VVGFSVTVVSGARRLVRVVPPANAVGAVVLVLRPVRALRVMLFDAPFDADFDAADFEGVDLDGVDFDAADLEVTDFDGADFEVVDFEARAVVDFAVAFEVDRPVLALLLSLATTPHSPVPERPVYPKQPKRRNPFLRSASAARVSGARSSRRGPAPPP